MSTVTAKPSSGARKARAEASVWIVRLHSEERTPQLEAGLREWLAVDPENARQFEHITDMWELGGAVTADGLPRMQKWPASKSAAWPVRAMAAAVVCCMVGFFAYLWWSGAGYTTGLGEQRLVRLDDGSRVYLNSDSRVRIEFEADERRVRLDRGEGLFEVAKDPQRPFIVQAGDRQVMALGTTFVVRYEPGRTAITLVEGKVTVSSLAPVPPDQTATSDLEPAQPRSDVFTLAPGERLTLANLSAPTIDAPRIEAVTAWRRGEVLLEATPLVEAIAEMNRYEQRSLVIDDPELAAVRVSGIYRTGDSLGFARAVAELHGLTVDAGTDEIHLRRGSSTVAR